MLIENATYKERCEQMRLRLERADSDLAFKIAENQRLLIENAAFKERCSMLVVLGYVVGVRLGRLLFSRTPPKTPNPGTLNPKPQAPKQQDELTFFSNYGVQSVELVAPGQNIISNLGWLQDYCRGLNNYLLQQGSDVRSGAEQIDMACVATSPSGAVAWADVPLDRPGGLCFGVEPLLLVLSESTLLCH